MDKKKRLVDDILKASDKNDETSALCAEAKKLYEEKKYNDAVKIWREAAEKNSAEALYMLGICHNYYLGVEDEIKREECCVAASKYFLKAAELDHPEAQCFAALCYNSGIGVEKDEEKMLFWFRRSAEQNCVEAMNNLAYFAEQGVGVQNEETKDEESFAWYKKSADLGSAAGQLGVGKAYYYGRGVKRSGTEAVKWFTLAAQQG